MTKKLEKIQFNGCVVLVKKRQKCNTFQFNLQQDRVRNP